MNQNQPQEYQPSLSGAGGNWQVIDEVVDPKVVKQQDGLSCGPACAEMLLKDRGINVNQTMIAEHTGVPLDSRTLALVLNALDTESSRKWMGGCLTIPGATESQLLNTLNTTGSWAALLKQLRPLVKLSHVVIVDGIDNTGYILIRDPWEGTRYKMRREDFLFHWTTDAIFSIIEP
ncbi:hypothetical protein WA1_26245 [Scytonema hofmannii PCC 7110]|uniref:Peptidase C39-like domain-containing protein n=1 Tax=Scytonema hofmannii PCC 7110 TaxID=128403 RepID=A0A139X7E2_9CYAN|nr:C39 family peptidase [Scytonema hofmannii]KYC40619.1 hypothetical protein WA1_26245 [Scytonema hofmannii PCC 7110]